MAGQTSQPGLRVKKMLRDNRKVNSSLVEFLRGFTCIPSDQTHIAKEITMFDS